MTSTALKSNTSRRFVPLLWAVAGFAAASCAQAASFSFATLGDLSERGSTAYDINNAGQIVGASRVADGSNHATLWDRSLVPTDLGAPYGTFSEARAINNAGQVVGWSDNHALLWDARSPVDLGSPTDGGTLAFASGINAAGQIAGTSGFHAVVWNNRIATSLPGPAPGSADATALNNLGMVVGTIRDGTSFGRATVWQGGLSRDLGTLSGGSSWAVAVNDAGTIAGFADVPSGAGIHAVRWSLDAGIVDLGTAGGRSNSWAYDINQSGLIAGFSSNGPDFSIATLWVDGKAIDLNTYLDRSTRSAGWILERAYGINDRGWVVGEAYNTLSGKSAAYVLSAVPEPASAGLLIVGLGLVGARVRRTAASGRAAPDPCDHVPE